jgi:pimeloyl-ACP methyl ester carboxylesterase
MDYVERLVSIGDGLKLYARDYPAQGKPAGLPVVCLHGLTRNSRDFEGIAPRIAGLGRRVVTIDMRGRGCSDYDPDPARYRPDVYAGDVLAVLKALEIPRAVFLGTSMGGIITMILGMTPGVVAAAILNDIGPRVATEGLQRIGSYVGKSDEFQDWPSLVEAVKRSQGAAFPKADAAFWSRFARRVAEETKDHKVRFSYDPAIGKSFSPGPAPDLTSLFLALSAAPILVLRGALSDILSADGLKHMQAVGPDLTSLELPDIGHAPTLDEEASWNAIREFLSRVS